MNNLLVPRPAGKVTSYNKNKEIKRDYNLYSIAQDVMKGANDIVGDVKFINVQMDIT